MSVRVCARIRPLLENELDRDVIVHADRVAEGKPLTLVKIPSPKNGAEEFSFAFNSVYEQATSQEDLFTAEGESPDALSPPPQRVSQLLTVHQWHHTSRRSSRA
jgi:hypothetical protein